MRLALLPLFIATCSAADITGYATPDGGFALTDAEGTLLTVAPVAWGPEWGWTGLKAELTEESGATRADVRGTLGKGGKAIRLGLRMTPEGKRRLKVDATLEAEADTALTLVVLALDPGQRFHGAGRCAVENAEGTGTRDVPFGRTGLGRQVTAARFGDALALRFTPAVDVVSDGAARVVLAEKKLKAGQPRSVTMTVDLGADLTWHALPSAIPDPPGFDRWFAWQPQHALDDAGAIGMQDWNDGPAGARGRVVRDGDRLTAAGKTAPFWGLNTCYGGCAPAKDLADRRAALYAKYGVNAVRLHKYADGHGWAGIQSADSFAAFDPAALDRMDYYVAALKAKGISVKLSPTFIVGLGAGDRTAVPYLDEFGALGGGTGARVKTGHGAIFLSRELQDLQIAQTLALLAHRNPHTGLTYAEDPAVMVVELFNEDSALFYGTMERLQKVPTLRRRAGEAFTGWLAKKYGDEAGLRKAWGDGAIGSFAGEGFADESFAARTIVPAGNPWFYDPDQLDGSQKAKRARLFDTMLFLKEQQDAFYARYAAALRKAGYQGEILSSNWVAGRAFSHYYNLASDRAIGIVDRHNYFSGPGSMLARAGSGILSIGLQQVGDRPFMLSEWISTFPNEWGVEGPAIMGAYGMGLQGWDVSYMFQNGDDGRFRDRLGEEWDVVAPQVLAIFPAVARQVRRGDVKASTLVAPRRVHLPSLAEGRLGFDDQGRQQGDIKEADSATVPARALAVARCTVEFTDAFVPTPTFDLAPFQQDGALVSSTKELRWTEGTSATSGFFTIDTAATKAVVGFAGGTSQKLGGVVIAPRTPFAAIYVTAQGRSETLADAKAVLIAAVARARNTGMKMIDGRLLVRGDKPILMEPVVADIVLPGAWSVRACDQDGRPTGPELAVDGGRFTIDGAAARTVYWQAVRR